MPAVQCDSCRRRYQVDANLVGKPVRCRQCGKAFIARPHGMDPSRTSMEPTRRGQMPADDDRSPNLDDLLASGDVSAPLGVDSDSLDELFAAAESAPKPGAAPVPNRYAYNNPLDIHASEPRPIRTAPGIPRRAGGVGWWVWLVAGAAGVAVLALLIWAISAALSPSGTPASSGPGKPKDSQASRSPGPDVPRPAGPTFILPPAPPGVGEFDVTSLPTLAGKVESIVLDTLGHPAAIGPFMFRPPAGHTIRGRREGDQPEVQTAGGGEIDTGTAAGKVPSQRLAVLVVPIAQAKYKSPEEMLKDPPLRYRQGIVNGWPFVVTYDVRSLSRDRFSYVSNYHVFTGNHVVIFEAIAAEPFSQSIHRELNLSVNTLAPLDVVAQALGDIAGGEGPRKVAAMRRLASQPAEGGRRDKVVAAIMSALRDSDGSLRAAAVEAAGVWIAEPAKRLEAVMPLLMDDDQAVRDQAIGVVASAGREDPAVIKAIGGVFEKSPGAASRAFKTIGQAAESTAIELLRKHADSSALAGNLFDVMDAIATTASTEQMRALSRSDKRAVAERARRILRKLDKNFDDVAEALLDLDRSAGPRVKQAVELLVGSKPDGRPASQRQAVVESLRRVAFDGTDDATSDRAADVLAVWATPDLVPKMAEVLNSQTTQRGVARRAIIVLAGLKDPRGVAPIRSWITRENDLVVESLKRIGPVAEDEVIAMLRDQQPSVRRDACLILGVIGGEKAIPQIRSLINDSRNPEVPAAAKAALEAIRARRPE